MIERYPATTIAFNFSVIEMDCDIIQALVNCASAALLKSSLHCRCLPIAVTMLLKNIDKRSSKKPSDWIVTDPNYSQLRH